MKTGNRQLASDGSRATSDDFVINIYTARNGYILKKKFTLSEIEGKGLNMRYENGSKGKKAIYAYFNNDYHAYAFKNAKTLREQFRGS
ncbi:MAG: hypothetical protein ACYS32_17250 [Planctomycetota bacterium]|jgi:uncharacterized protein YecE (DUF72 family)